jgi:hypothetical protein
MSGKKHEIYCCECDKKLLTMELTEDYDEVFVISNILKDKNIITCDECADADQDRENTFLRMGLGSRLNDIAQTTDSRPNLRRRADYARVKRILAEYIGELGRGRCPDGYHKYVFEAFVDALYDRGAVEWIRARE